MKDYPFVISLTHCSLSVNAVENETTLLNGSIVISSANIIVILKFAIIHCNNVTSVRGRVMAQ